MGKKGQQRMAERATGEAEIQRNSKYIPENPRKIQRVKGSPQ